MDKVLDALFLVTLGWIGVCLWLICWRGPRTR